MERPDAVLIAGPTASGKSGLAMAIARQVGGVVVNADSMQVYDGLQILTARPDAAALGEVPHRLYGHVDPRDDYSVGVWLREARSAAGELRAAGLVPVFCGGTGLYFKALTEGLTGAPPVDPALRETLRRRMVEEGPARLHAELATIDPAAAARIRPSDPQRIVRALELGLQPGPVDTPVAEPRIVDPGRCASIVLAPDRVALRAAIDRRFRQMVEGGAVEEALAFEARYGSEDRLATHAIGLAELLEHARGEIGLDAAIERAVTRSRQYAKRQETFFRNQFGDGWHRFATAASALDAWNSGGGSPLDGFGQQQAGQDEWSTSE